MKTLYIDCGMGAAGDMLTAALLELVPDKEAMVNKLNALDLPGVVYKAESSVKCGITGTHMSVTVNGEEEESIDVDDENHHDHDHDHDHDHHHDHDHDHDHEHHHDHDHEHEHHHDHDHEGHHHHHHTSLADIEHIVKDHLDVPEKVKEDILAVYKLIAEAESQVHGAPVNEIHFHEVGSLDAVADVTAVCLLMNEIGPDKVVVSPVHVGSGKVKCAHGILPVPAPATALILKDIPIYQGDIKGELCTPTGAALLKHFATEFSKMPVMRVSVIGYGMGKKDFEVANCVRASLGESEGSNDDVFELSCNLDDMTGEEIGYATETLLKEGALDVYTTPIGMKKNRPGVMLSVLCRPSDKEKLVKALFKHTSTLGIRENAFKRYTLNREFKKTDSEFGPVTVKRSEGYGTVNEKPEFEEIRKIAEERGLSLSDVINKIKK